MKRFNAVLRLALFSGVLIVMLGACRGQSDRPASPGAGITEVTREDLASGASERAAGQTIGLNRVIIPAGKDIATHTHPGPQLAVIAEGTLTYSVLKGEVQVTRAAGTSRARTETVKAGQTTDLRAGDSLVETPELVHAARNQGKTPVVIYTSTLFPNGAPASSPAQ